MAQPFGFVVVADDEAGSSGKVLFLVVGGEKGTETLEGRGSLGLLDSKIEVLLILVESLEEAGVVGREQLGLFAGDLMRINL